MQFLRRKHLSDRQLRRAKFSVGALAATLTVQILVEKIVQAYTYQGEEYSLQDIQQYSKGQIVEFTNKEELCHGFVVGPGLSIMPNNFLIVFYMLFLFWLFLGISIISDIFMASIENITSAKQYVTRRDENDVAYQVKVNVWNPTLANLTLMALGSSAPEIFLSIIETVQTLEVTPGELGPSTIVGSAAFNFLVITGVSIYAVDASSDNRTDEQIEEDGTDKGVKKVLNMMVFTITTTWAVLAYMWLYYVLMDKKVSNLEAYLTLAYFFILLGMAFAADKYFEGQMKKRMKDKYGDLDGGEKHQQEGATNFEFKEVMDINIKEQSNKLPEKDKKKAQQMREFLIKEFGTTKVQEINETDLKNKLEGTKLIERIGYRRKTGFLNKKEVVPKGAVIRRENRMATTLEEKDRNPNFGFTCLHHSVSEGARYVRIKVEKKGNVDKVGVRTKDGDAQSGKDYGLLNEIVEFKGGKKVAEVQITIFDDEQWEPDEDFYVELFDPDHDQKPRLPGADTRTTVTILDDDKPGVLAFKEKGVHKHIATDDVCRIFVQRLHASDGNITCQYQTIELSKSDRTATPGKDYIHKEGTLTFESGNQLQEIMIDIPQRELGMDDKEERNEIFGVQIFDAEPVEVKISKKDTLMVEIVKDAESQKQAEALQQLLERINQQESITWGRQIKNSCMLHPTKNEDGEIEDVSAFDAVFHFLSIGFKVLFSLCPPPHIWGGWACFIVAICMIGATTAVVGEVAALMGCVMGLKPGVTAVTFVAIGTSLPDTFASKTAAQESRYADSAVGNVTGSNSVNVFLGLGLPWCIATIYKQRQGKIYEQAANGLDLSVALFLAVSLVGILVLIIRRCWVGGELGGSQAGRAVSAFIFISLWLIYISVYTLYQYGVITIG